MNVKKEVYDRCFAMIDREFSDIQHKIFMNKRAINDLSKQQRVLKSEMGKLHELKRLFAK
jgi:hypothetical protein